MHMLHRAQDSSCGAELSIYTNNLQAGTAYDFRLNVSGVSENHSRRGDCFSSGRHDRRLWCACPHAFGTLLVRSACVPFGRSFSILFLPQFLCSGLAFSVARHFRKLVCQSAVLYHNDKSDKNDKSGDKKCDKVTKSRFEPNLRHILIYLMADQDKALLNALGYYILSAAAECAHISYTQNCSVYYLDIHRHSNAMA